MASKARKEKNIQEEIIKEISEDATDSAFQTLSEHRDNEELDSSSDLDESFSSGETPECILERSESVVSTFYTLSEFKDRDSSSESDDTRCAIPEYMPELSKAIGNLVLKTDSEKMKQPGVLVQEEHAPTDQQLNVCAVSIAAVSCEALNSTKEGKPATEVKTGRQSPELSKGISLGISNEKSQEQSKASVNYFREDSSVQSAEKQKETPAGSDGMTADAVLFLGSTFRPAEAENTPEDTRERQNAETTLKDTREQQKAKKNNKEKGLSISRQLCHRSLNGKPARLAALKNADWFTAKYANLETGQAVLAQVHDQEASFVGLKPQCEEALKQCQEYVESLKEAQMRIKDEVAILLTRTQKGSDLLINLSKDFTDIGYVVVCKDDTNTNTKSHQRSKHSFISYAAKSPATISAFGVRVGNSLLNKSIEVPLSRFTEGDFEILRQSCEQDFCVSFIECQSQTEHRQGQVIKGQTINVCGIKHDVEHVIAILSEFIENNEIVHKSYDIQSDDLVVLERWNVLHNVCDKVLHKRVRTAHDGDGISLILTVHRHDLAHMDTLMAGFQTRLSETVVRLNLASLYDDWQQALIINGVNSTGNRRLCTDLENELTEKGIMESVIVFPTCQDRHLPEFSFLKEDDTTSAVMDKMPGDYGITFSHSLEMFSVIKESAFETLADGIVCFVDETGYLGVLENVPGSDSGRVSPVEPFQCFVSQCSDHTLFQFAFPKDSPNGYMEKLSMLMNNCLDEAENLGLESIVFVTPLSKLQDMDYDPELVVEAIVDGAVAYIESAHRKIQRLIFAAEEDDMAYDLLLSAILNRTRSPERESSLTQPQSTASEQLCLSLYVDQMIDRDLAAGLLLEQLENKFLRREVLADASIIRELDPDVHSYLMSQSSAVYISVENDDQTGVKQLVVLGQFLKVKAVQDYVQKAIAGHTPLFSVCLPRYWSISTPGEAQKEFIAQRAKGQKFTLAKLDDVQKIDFENLMNRAMRSNRRIIKVLEVHRLENPDLWEKYSEQKGKFMRRLGDSSASFPDIGTMDGSSGPVLTSNVEQESIFCTSITPTINEVFLFHGHLAKARLSLAKSGLDMRLAGSIHGSNHGKGIYASDDICKADMYTDKTVSVKHMLLVRVLLGDPHIMKFCNKFRRAPCKSCLLDFCTCPSPQFDSVVFDSPGRQREFIVYDSSQCYPEYFITYKSPNDR